MTAFLCSIRDKKRKEHQNCQRTVTRISVRLYREYAVRYKYEKGLLHQRSSPFLYFMHFLSSVIPAEFIGKDEDNTGCECDTEHFQKTEYRKSMGAYSGIGQPEYAADHCEKYNCFQQL